MAAGAIQICERKYNIFKFFLEQMEYKSYRWYNKEIILRQKKRCTSSLFLYCTIKPHGKS
jgi:hypothetical protein